MKHFKIKPGINLADRVWILEEKKRFKKWKPIYKHNKLIVVIGMKNHLLLPERLYTVEDNVSPENDKSFFKDKFDNEEEF